jgi:hypothetical protein
MDTQQQNEHRAVVIPPSISELTTAQNSRSEYAS